MTYIPVGYQPKGNATQKVTPPTGGTAEVENKRGGMGMSLGDEEYIVKPCPFCGNKKEFGIGRQTEDREGWPTYIYCPSCGAIGPWFYTRDKMYFTNTYMCAERSGWNNRIGEQ